MKIPTLHVCIYLLPYYAFLYKPNQRYRLRYPTFSRSRADQVEWGERGFQCRLRTRAPHNFYYSRMDYSGQELQNGSKLKQLGAVVHEDRVF